MSLKQKFTKCIICDTYYIDNNKREHNNTPVHLKNLFRSYKENCSLIEKAFKNDIEVYFVKNRRHKVISNFLNNYVKYYFLKKTKDILVHKKSLKVQIILQCFFKKIMNEEDDVTPCSFKTKNVILTSESDLHEIFESMSTCIEAEISDMMAKGSSFTLQSIGGCTIRYYLYQPLSASSFIKTPDFVRKTQAVVNVKNLDKMCFKWSMLCKYNVGNAHFIKNLLKFEDKYNWTDLTWPMTLDNIDRFQKNNPNSSINVYAIQGDEVIPLRTCNSELEDHTDLLLLKNEENNFHFTYIKSVYQLVAPQIKKTFLKARTFKFICKRCFLPHSTQHTLSLHTCNGIVQKLALPSNPLTDILQNTSYVYCAETAEDSFQKCIKYKEEKRFNWFDMGAHVLMKDVIKFERLNDVSINIFSFESEKKKYKLVPLKVIKTEKDLHYDLILTINGNNMHFFSLILNFDKFFAKCTNRHYTQYICKTCFTNFTTEERLLEHKRYCAENAPVHAILPNKGENILKFTNFEREIKVPFAVYFDFETLLVKHSNSEKEDASKDNNSSYSVALQSHKPYAFAYYIVGPADFENKLVEYMSEDESVDIVKVFYEMVEKDVLRIDAYYNNKSKVNLSPEEELKFSLETQCAHCLMAFSDKVVKCRDHYSYSDGKTLRKALCRNCNFKFRNSKFVPFYAHNLSNYDGHLICKGLGYNDKEITVIPNTGEKYVSFSKRVSETLSIRFVDSFRFMSASLKTLVDSVSRENFVHLRRYFPQTEDNHLVLQKGIFPYEYCSSFEKLLVDHLPSHSSFYSSLTNSNVSLDDYYHAKRVFSHFQCRNLRDYSQLYLKTDVLLLADVFESFRDLCLRIYNLDPSWYYTIPAFSFDAALKITKVELELLTDMDMYLFFERSIRGGLSQASKKYVEANNKYMSEHDATSPDSYLYFIDANSLYSYAMNQKHADRNFEWIEEEELHEVVGKLASYNGREEIGYFLEVDVDYPPELHDRHNDLPFLVEKKKSPVSGNLKLLATLESKQNYVVHYLTLKQALEHGLVLKRVHRGIKFHQSDWLSKYVTMNAGYRAKAKSSFDKNQYKNYSNSVFGKFLQKVRDRIDVRLITKQHIARKLIAKPTFEESIVFNENLVLFKMLRKIVKFDKPVYLGASILDQSKILLYHFHYDVILPKFGFDNVNLCYTDTDSLIYEIFVQDLYKDLEELKEHLDTSDYPENHSLYSIKNKKVVGKFKDELNGAIMTHFIALASKLYAFKTSDSKTHKKAKGINKSVTEKEITFYDYYTCLFNNTLLYKSMVNFVSKNHEISSVLRNKVALNNSDDKRYQMGNKIDTLAFAHYKIGTQEEEGGDEGNL